MGIFILVLVLFILWITLGSMAEVAALVFWTGVIILTIAAVVTLLSWMKKERNR